MKLRKKLIEVALPLEAINKAAAIEKSNPFLKGHPRSLHQWWARRPLPVARAVIFSQMVDDPSEYVDVLKMDDKLRRRAETELKKRHAVWKEAAAVLERAEAAGIEAPPPGPGPTLDAVIAEQERDRLFKIIEDLVIWENTTNETVLNKARVEIDLSWKRTCADNADHPRAKELFDRNKLPAFHDPFAGGGALPLEAQRLGLEAYASDLNPVAVLINKAMIEIPPKFAGMPPVNPEWQSKSEAEKALKVWHGAEGLADDVRYYAKWMRDETEKRIGHLYPKVEITREMAKNRPDLKQYVGGKLTVIDWIWARTVKSPNPAFRNVDVPLASTFMLSTRANKEAYIDPVVGDVGFRFHVQIGKPADEVAAKNGTSAGKRKAFKCLISGVPIEYDYIRSEAMAGRMGEQLMAMVATTGRGRCYLPPTENHERVARMTSAPWKPDSEMPKKHRNFQPPIYGMSNMGDLFTDRQLTCLSTLSDLVLELNSAMKQDFEANGVPKRKAELTEYANSISVYMALLIDKLADYNNSICTWNPTNENIGHLFTKQAIPMAWDFPEASPIAGGLSIDSISEGIAKAILPLPASGLGIVCQGDAATQSATLDKIVSTDPPYYDNVAYADLSDFFYVWLRRSLRPIFPDLFATLVVPKNEEIVAMVTRHNSKAESESFFLSTMTEAMSRISLQSHPAFPVTIYYAFKQSETEHTSGTASTGWETFLEAVITAGFSLTGTWPVRTERAARAVGQGANALASSIVLVCKKRIKSAQIVTRREFINALKSELPDALRHLQRGNIAPVDLAQAAIGPGMAVYTRYEKVLDAEGEPLTVRDALILINDILGEVLAEQEGDFDADTRWALAWFEEYGYGEGEFGVADVLARAKVTSVQGVVDAGFAIAGKGKVRLMSPEELPEDWTPEGDRRLTVWDMVHHLIRVLEAKVGGGEVAAAQLAAKLGAKAETARELCYRLYTLCERKKRAAEALSYNGLVQSWPEIMRLAREQGATPAVEQGEMFSE